MDILFCIVPHFDIDMPTIAPAILNSVVRNNNLTSKLIDFNIELSKNYIDVFNGDVKDWVNVDLIFSYKKDYQYEKLDRLLDEWVKTIISYSPKYVAFSILSYFNYKCVVELAKRIKHTDIKIIVGGVSTQWFKEYLIDNKIEHLIDHLVIGYGEKAILQIIKGENKEKIIYDFDIDLTPNIIPDYSDLDLSQYTQNRLFLSTSRGCIYNCAFCHVRYIWKTLNCRPIANVIDEMKYLTNTYNIDYFKTTDSIINAIMPRYRELCNELTKYNFNWDAMFRIRNKIMTDNDYKILKDSGCNFLLIGIESGSEKVRKSMNKEFTNKDVFETLDKLEKYKINACLMYMTGFPTEEKEDFELTKQMLYELKRKNYSIIKSIRTQPFTATNLSDITLNRNYEDRISRYEEMRHLIKELNFVIKRDSRLKQWYK